MRRRRFLAAGAVGLGATVAGCSALGSGEQGHPFAGATVTVRVDAESDTAYDIEANARGVLDFWEETGPEYVGFEVAFEIVDDDPDIVLAYDESAEGCSDIRGFNERVLGCAPMLGPNTTVPDPVVATVVAGPRPVGDVTTTAKHEIGHVLGLGHRDDPPEVMSDRPEDRIPLYEDRIDIWETVLDARERANGASTLFADGIDEWNAESYAAAEETFGAASDEFETARAAVVDATAQTDIFEGHPRSDTINLDRLRELLARLERRTDVATVFSGRMVDAAAAAGAGDLETADARRSEAAAGIEEFNDIGQTQLREVSIALGIVRGFDREDRVVTVEEGSSGNESQDS